jgi:ATP-binding cassette subfamily F protein 3
MHIIHLDDVAVNFAGREIFTGLTWAVGDRDRVGLVGPNGAGKSTLLRLVTGDLTPDAGFVRRVGEVSVGLLPQIVALPAGLTVWQVASASPPALARVEADLAEVEVRLADPTVYSDLDKLDRVLDRQEALIGEYESLGGPRHAALIRELLAHLGFDKADHELPVEALSGGQKKLVALARLAAERPDVLLLDEPDNHLDLPARNALEAFINGYEGAVVIVSHDRYLLDGVATHIAELEEGRLTVYPGNYSAYTAEREVRRLRQQQLYVTQQKEIARLEAAIARFELWASMVVEVRHIRQARSRRRMLDKMEANGEIIEAVRERRTMGLELNGWRGSTKTLEARRLSMGFDGDLLFVDLSFTLRHGERVGLVGPNGVGKSVLFRLLLGEMTPLEGEVIVGPSVEIGTYAQEHQTLDVWLDRTPLDLVRYSVPRREEAAVSFLLKMAFSYDQVRQPIRTMSGGERSRLQLALLMLQNPNLLLLDEPTNNLDIPSAEVLEAVLEAFEGTVFVISHDRYFLDRIVDRVLVLDGGEMVEVAGGYTDGVEKGVLHQG